MKNCILIQGGDAFDLEAEVKKHSADTLHFQGGEVKAGELEEALFTPSFFGDTLIVIEDAQDLSEKALELVIAFSKKPTPKIALILHATCKSELSAHITPIEIQEVKPWEKQAKMADWIMTFLKGRGIKASPQVATFIAATGMADRFSLSQELEKLITYVGDKKEITLDDVQAIGALEHEHTVWQLTDAFLERNRVKAQMLLHELLEQDAAPFLIVRQLRNVCHQALMMLSLSESGHTNIQEHFPQLRGKLFDKNFRLAKDAGSPYLKRMLLMLDQTERKLKDAPFDETALIMKVLL